MTPGAKQRGDTIIEVMLVIAVLSAVLGGTFVTLNRSFNNTRQAQERSEAVKLLESQLELTKAELKSGNTPISDGSRFCLSGNVVILSTNPDFGSLCQRGTIPGGYNLEVIRNGTLFTARATWAAVGGTGNDTASLVYRLYP